MALIDGRPFLDLIVEQVVTYGFRRVIFCAGYKAEWINRYAGGRSDITALISHEREPLGTGGALKACRHLITSSTVLVLNGDSLCRIDMTAFLLVHRKREACATVAVVQSDGRSDGGGISLNSDDRIVRFQEKASESFLNAGVYALDSCLLDRIPDHTPCSLEREVFPELLDRPLYGFRTCAPLHDIGTPERLKEFRAWYRTCDGKGIEKEAAC